MKTAILSLAVCIALLGAAADAREPVKPAPPAAFTSASEDSDDLGDAWRAYRREVTDAMVASASPRDWALAASSMFSVDETESGPAWPSPAKLMERAAERAPDDVLVQWIAATDRLNTRSCKATPLPDDNVRALLRMEPENGAAWMFALTLAAQRHDDVGIDDALAHMASSARFDEHFGDNLVARMAVYDRFPLPAALSGMFAGYDDLSAADLQALSGFTSAMAEASAAALPSFGALLKVCKPSEAASDTWQRFALCEDAGRLMLTKGTTLVAQGIGFAVLRNLGPAVLTPADHRARRNDDWLREHAMTTFELDVERDQFAVYVDDWRSTRSEIEVARRALRRNGLAVEAPEGWIPAGSALSTADRAGGE